MGFGIMTNYSSRSESFLIAENHVYIVDAGKTKKGANLIIKYKHLLNNLDCFVISHGDSDHIGLANTIIEELEPEVIIISPVVYALERFRHYFNPANVRLLALFENEYIVNTEVIEPVLDSNEYRDEDNNPKRIIYAKKNSVNNLQPWKTTYDSTMLSEIETFPTKSAQYHTDQINDFIDSINSQKYQSSSWFNEINKHKLITDLRKGKLLSNKQYNLSNNNYLYMWDEIESAIIKKMRNEMSLVCRIGSTFFTGDATKKQLEEIKDILINQSNMLGNNITIKVNHHGSVNKYYEYLEFYQEMKPKQLLLKRDYQIQGPKKSPNSRFITYVNDLKTLVPNGFIDSKKMEDSGMYFMGFYTL